MKLIKPVLWTVFGMVVGAAAVVTASGVQARQQRPSERIQINAAGGDRSGNFGVYFVKDSKSGGCWIGSKGDSVWAALAVAPANACD